jgi:hypothetical protein
VEEDSQAFMERYIRERAVAPVRPGSPGLLEEERRIWWKFCLWMCEVLGGFKCGSRFTRDQAHQICRLRWICIRGTYVFATPDPELSAEQRRYVELCKCIVAAYAVIADHAEGIHDMCVSGFAMDQSKEPAFCEALVGEAWLRWWQTWENAISPIAWVRYVAHVVHREHCPRALDQEPDIRSLDTASPTGDPYAAMLPDLRAIGCTEIDAIVDLETACEREGLTPETSQLARGRYHGVPLSSAAEVLGLSEQDLAAARRELRTAMPSLQARLECYREKRNHK